MHGSLIPLFQNPYIMRGFSKSRVQSHNQFNVFGSFSHLSLIFNNNEAVNGDIISKDARFHDSAMLPIAKRPQDGCIYYGGEVPPRKFIQEAGRVWECREPVPQQCRDFLKSLIEVRKVGGVKPCAYDRHIF